MGRFPLVHALGATLVDHALGVAEDDVVGLEAHRLEQLGAGDRRRAGAVDDEAGRLDVAAGQIERVDQSGGGDDCGAVLVVVEDGDVHQLAQSLLDDEAFGRLDVLEIDAAEGRPEIAHRVDELVGVLGVDLQIDRIDVGKALEQHRLALHHRLGGERAEIAKTEDGSAVGDHGNEIGTRGVVIGLGRILGDRQDRHGNARRIGQRQIALRRHRHGRDDLELARASFRMEQQRLLIGEGRAGAFYRRTVGHGLNLFCERFLERGGP
jgi:hypothetical protein